MQALLLSLLLSNPIVLGNSAVALNGPWKFHVGDEARWAEKDFDDSAWESVDWTPEAGARDNDVGLTGYVPGWQARGHHGYSGYAWYRLRFSVEVPSAEPIALSGPPYVDSAYQIFVNGRLVGEFGNFSTATPTVYGIHRPKLFPLGSTDPSLANSNYVVAFRVWMGPWMLGDPRSGGIYIAPSLGTASGADAAYRARWWETIRGYLVDATEAVIFWLLALVACRLLLFDRANSAYGWMAAALLFIGVARANQAMFFWWEFESYRGIEMVTGVLMIPLSLAAWTLTWYHWVKPRRLGWLPAIAVTLVFILMLSTFLRRSWFYGAFPPAFEAALRFCSQSVRVGFVILTLLILWRAIVEPSREKWLLVAAILLVSTGLFAQELSLIGIPGIWFPFGVGVSRTEYAYVIFDIALAALLFGRLRYSSTDHAL
jgi:hypothetical protein